MFTAQYMLTPYILPSANRPESRRPAVLRRRGVAQHLRLLGQDQEGSGAPRNVLRIQDGRRVPMQGEAQAEEEINHSKTIFMAFYNPKIQQLL